MTFVEAAEEILRRYNRPMTAGDIVNEALRIGLLETRSVDKAATMRYSLGDIRRSDKQEASSIVKIDSIHWGLREWTTVKPHERWGEGFAVGSIYTRGEISDYFGTNDASINNGVFKPKGRNIVLLFVTAKKTKDRPQYKDQLSGEILEWDGQISGRTDYLIKEHKKLDVTLLVFYRKSRGEFPNSGFIFLGNAIFLRSTGSHPTHFWLRLEALQDMADDEPNLTYLEGAQRKKAMTAYERDPGARAAAISIHGTTCQVCGFNFESFYGSRGIGYAEVHHVIPLSVTGVERETDPEKDLIVLCSNCHRMIHRVRSDTITPDGLRSMIRGAYQ